MQHSRTFSLVNESKCAPGQNKQAWGSLFRGKPERCVKGTEPILLMMLVKTESIASFGGSPRKENWTNCSTHRSCCAQRKMIHLLCQGAHHVCRLHWHRMVHRWRNHSTCWLHNVWRMRHPWSTLDLVCGDRGSSNEWRDGCLWNHAVGCNTVRWRIKSILNGGCGVIGQSHASLSFPGPRPSILGVFTLILSLLLSSISEFAQ